MHFLGRVFALSCIRLIHEKMVPLFPTITTDEELHKNPRPISIQKLVPQHAPSAQQQFKHLPADRLQSAARRAAADLQLEQTTRTLLQALNLQAQPSPSPGAERRTRSSAGRTRIQADKATHSDSEVSSISHRRDFETCDSVQQVTTATTLISEQATQTAASADGGRAGIGGQLPSLHLLRTLQSRLVSSLQQVGELRAQGPWQSRVLDQHDWDRKLARMDEFHAKITREMYILTRQVDLIMDGVCSIPRTRMTSSLKGDVIRKLVRAHRSALRVTQAFVLNYWDGSLDGRQAGRFLQLLSVCRSLTDVCQHLDVDAVPDLADLPERLAAMVRQHVTTAGDVGSLIREMALGRFGPAAAEAAAAVAARHEAARHESARHDSARHDAQDRQTRRSGPPAPRSQASSRQGQTTNRSQFKVKSAIDRLRSRRPGEKMSVRSAPVVRRTAAIRRPGRPGSAPLAAPKGRPCGDHAPLTPLPEEGDTGSSDEDHHRAPPALWTDHRDQPDLRQRHSPGPVRAVWSGPDRAGQVLAATVEEAVRRALLGSAATPGPSAPGRGAGSAAGMVREPSPGRRDMRQQQQKSSRDGPASQHSGKDTGWRKDREDGQDSCGDDMDERGRLADRRGNDTADGSCEASPSRGADKPDARARTQVGRGGSGVDARGRSHDRPGHRRKKETNRKTQRGAERLRTQLRHVLARLEELQKQRAVIRQRWAPLILARQQNEERDICLDLDADFLRGSTLPGTATASGARGTFTVERPLGTDLRTDGGSGLQSQWRPLADAATSTSTLTVPPPTSTLTVPPLSTGTPAGRPPPPPTGIFGEDPSGDQRRSVRDVFAAEALDPQLRADLTQQFRGLLGNCDDSAIKGLPQETVNQLVDEFISEAGVDIFLQQLFDQEFEMR